MNDVGQNSGPIFQDSAFRGQVFLVVGGSRGIGLQYSTDLARLGASVVIASPSDAADLAAESLRAAGGKATSIRADVRDAERIVATALEQFGRIDGMIVNSGIVRDRSFRKMMLEDWGDVISVNLTGAFLCAKAVWPVMLEQARGSILLTTSGAGMHGNFGQANYAAAKAGIIGLAKSLALEGRTHSIRVNAIAPMATTDMTGSVFSDELKNALTVEQVSAAALALMHPQASATGLVIEAGGGWASQLIWERSRGVHLETAAPSDFLNAWNSITDFSAGSDHPESIQDCLKAALNRGQR